MNTFLAQQVFRYFLTSQHKRGHGIHSPFVYNLIRSVFIDTTKYPEYATIEKVRTQLLSNKSSITLQDFGAGSQSLQGTQRRICDIASSSLSPKKYAQLLFRLIRYTKPSNILEMGTSLGISGAYMSLGHPHARCISLEGSAEIARVAQQTTLQCNCSHIDIRIGQFSQTLLQALEDLGTVDFVFVDGNHQKDATIEYFETIFPYCNEHTILVFDDIYWSQGMLEAWQHIIADTRVRISIDLCKLGIVFFRTGIVKQDFRIRY